MELRTNRSRLHTLFRDMVDLYSPSGKEEELSDLLKERLQASGLSVVRQSVDETRDNLLISSGTGIPDQLFLGHIDTVPAYDIEHYGFIEKEGLVHGLGTADMKSGCAAMIEAFLSTAEQGTLPDNVLLALVVGEEEAGDGTQALLQSRSFQTAIVAEPTDLKPCMAHYGYVELIIRAFGYRRHAAMSGRDTNAIHAMLRFLIQLEDRIESSEPETVLNIRDLHSSESGFAVPDRCAAAIDLHIPPGIRSCAYAEALRTFIDRALTGSRASKYDVEFPTLADGYEMARESALAQELKRIFQTLEMNWEPAAFKSHSDANLLRDAGCLSVILGPGQLAKAHTRDESVDFEQVVTAAEIYTRLLNNS
ncbi:M20 family metallopeptidase [Tichowtungia aerotolerans]|uniref:M20/M25/M40 family metallo-hydrolase n=1 Tax=Tichowtungia aerotolerans TaxID=2697043 RepID=A0A6P1M549_9BACT|nr:M20/M25/M40 family metallo-hydrolase [Tichowtungia aerotolerans]QHI68977.1 M20/M25/M40 family metallo-hydrolase [Tichowtungia aerotolerans]